MIAHRRGGGGTGFVGERGAIMVEAAFALPIMVMLAVGIIAFGQAYNDASIASGATRTGARLASATYASAPDKSVAAATIQSAVAGDLANLKSAVPVEIWMYKANSAGMPSSGSFSSCGSDCVRWTWNASTSSWSGASGSWSDPDGCGATTDYVGIFVKADLKLKTAIFTNTITVKQRTLMRIEPVVTTLCL